VGCLPAPHHLVPVDHRDEDRRPDRDPAPLGNAPVQLGYRHADFLLGVHLGDVLHQPGAFLTQPERRWQQFLG
jgi:hypothetical protein